MAHVEVVRQCIEESPFTIRGKNRPKKAPKKGAKTPARATAKKVKESHKQVKVTVSIGVAERTDDVTDPGAVMKLADKALYQAKRKGRNQVCR